MSAWKVCARDNGKFSAKKSDDLHRLPLQIFNHLDFICQLEEEYMKIPVGGINLGLLN